MENIISKRVVTGKDTKMKLKKVMVTPLLIHEIETWTMTRYDERRIRTSQMKFLKKNQRLHP